MLGACRGMHGGVGMAQDREGSVARRQALEPQGVVGTPSPLTVRGEGSLCTPVPLPSETDKPEHNRGG